MSGWLLREGKKGARRKVKDEGWRLMGKQFLSLFLLAEVILLFSSSKLGRVAEISSPERWRCSASQLQEERGQRRERLAAGARRCHRGQHCCFFFFFVSFGKHQGQALGVNLEWFQRSWICPAVLDAGVTGLQEGAAGKCPRGQRGAFRFAELYIATSRPHCLTSEFITFPFVWLTS